VVEDREELLKVRESLGILQELSGRQTNSAPKEGIQDLIQCRSSGLITYSITTAQDGRDLLESQKKYAK